MDAVQFGKQTKNDSKETTCSILYLEFSRSWLFLLIWHFYPYKTLTKNY